MTKNKIKLFAVIFALLLALGTVAIFAACNNGGNGLPPPSNGPTQPDDSNSNNNANQARNSLNRQVQTAYETSENIFSALLGTSSEAQTAHLSTAVMAFETQSAQASQISINDIFALSGRSPILSGLSSVMIIDYFAYLSVLNSIIDAYGYNSVIMDYNIDYGTSYIETMLEINYAAFGVHPDIATQSTRENFLNGFTGGYLGWRNYIPARLSLSGVNEETNHVYFMYENIVKPMNQIHYQRYDTFVGYKRFFFNSYEDFGFERIYKHYYNGNLINRAFNYHCNLNGISLSITERFLPNGDRNYAAIPRGQNAGSYIYFGGVAIMTFAQIGQRVVFGEEAFFMQEHRIEMIDTFMSEAIDRVVGGNERLREDNKTLAMQLQDGTEQSNQASQNDSPTRPISPTPHLVEFDFDLLRELLGRQ